jgi:hypothetical protein
VRKRTYRLFKYLTASWKTAHGSQEYEQVSALDAKCSHSIPCIADKRRAYLECASMGLVPDCQSASLTHRAVTRESRDCQEAGSMSMTSCSGGLRIA